MTYTTIKIPMEIHRRLVSIAQKRNMTMRDVLNKSLQEFENLIFWENCSDAYEKAVTDKKVDSDDMLYENTVADGLDDEY